MRSMGLDQPVGVEGACLGGEAGGDEKCGVCQSGRGVRSRFHKSAP